MRWSVPKRKRKVQFWNVDYRTSSGTRNPQVSSSFFSTPREEQKRTFLVLLPATLFYGLPSDYHLSLVCAGGLTGFSVPLLPNTELYQHLSLETVEHAYQEALKPLEV